MVVNAEWIKQKYDFFNQKYWGGKLPTNIAFETDRSKKRWGGAGFSYKYRGYGRNQVKISITPTKITISNYYDSPERIKETTLLHEMIHIADYYFHPEHYLGLNGKKYDPHGSDFFIPEARRLAADGWDIEKYVTQEEMNSSTMSDATVKRIRQNAKMGYALCVLTRKDGGFFDYFKTSSNLIDYMDSVLMSVWKNWLIKNITKISWYKTTSIEFADMRTCKKKPSIYLASDATMNKLNKAIHDEETVLVKEHGVDEQTDGDDASISVAVRKNLDNIWRRVSSTILDGNALDDILYDLKSYGSFRTRYNIVLLNKEYRIYLTTDKDYCVIDNENETLFIYVDLNKLIKLNQTFGKRTYMSIKTDVYKELFMVKILNEGKYNRLSDIITEEINNVVSHKIKNPVDFLTGLTNVEVKRLSDNECEVELE